MNQKTEVYHAGVDIIPNPDTIHSRRELDFGPGFYVTDVYEQAVNWSRNRARVYHKDPIINKYLLDREGLSAETGSRHKIFSSYDDEWLEFIVGNRQGRDLWKAYDYIEGGVADDRVIDTVNLYMTGLYTREYAISQLKYLKSNNQICINNQALLDRYLRFEDAVKLDSL